MKDGISDVDGVCADYDNDFRFKLKGRRRSETGRFTWTERLTVGDCQEVVQRLTVLLNKNLMRCDRDVDRGAQHTWQKLALS